MESDHCSLLACTEDKEESQPKIESDHCSLLVSTEGKEEPSRKHFISLEQSRDPPDSLKAAEVNRSNDHGVQPAKEEESDGVDFLSTNRDVMIIVAMLCFLQALLSWCDVVLAKIYSLPPEVGQFVDISSTEYALLTGWIFMIPYLGSALFTGNLGDVRIVWRHRALFGGTSMAGIAVILLAACSDFKSLAACTVLLGIGTGAVRPCAYAIITQICPPSFVTRGLGVYLAGPPIGKGAAHMTLWLVEAFGWRGLCRFLGGTLLLSSVIMFIHQPPLLAASTSDETMKAQTRKTSLTWSAITEPFVGGLRRLAASPVFVSLIMASTLSNSGGHLVDAWAGIYFRNTFPSQFGVYMSVAAVFSVLGGGLSSLVAGYITDKLEFHQVRAAKLRVCSVMAGLRLATMMGCLLLPFNFTLALLLLGLSSILHEAAPMIAYLQLLVPKELRGKASGLEITLTSLSSACTDLMVGVLEDHFHKLRFELGLGFVLTLGGATFLYRITMRNDTNGFKQLGGMTAQT